MREVAKKKKEKEKLERKTIEGPSGKKEGYSVYFLSCAVWIE